MKQCSSIFLGLGLFAVAFSYATAYSTGYFADVVSTTLFFVSPVIVLPSLFISFLGLLILLALSLIRRRDCLRTSLSLLGFAAVFIVVLKWLPPPAAMLAYGTKAGIMRVYSLDTLRQFANEVHQGIAFTGTPPHRKGVYHGDDSTLNDPERKVYAGLLSKYPFLHRMDGASIFCSDDGVVDFEWGGALTGHWGCAISTSRTTDVPKSTADTTILPVSDDIYFFAGE